MIIRGNETLFLQIAENFDRIAESHQAFKLIWENIRCQPLEIVIGSEQDLIDDSHNASKTLHEFRSYTLNKVIYLFNTRYETIESLTYLFLHELCHVMIQANPYTFLTLQAITGNFLVDNGHQIDLASQFWTQKAYEDIIKTNEIHDQLPEERLCDDFASALIGFRYDRSWWWDRWEEIDE